MANEWLSRWTKGFKKISRDAKLIVGKQILRKETDLTESVRKRIRQGLDAEGNPLKPLEIITLRSNVTNDVRPYETVLGSRISYGTTPMVATGKTVSAIVVKGRGTQVEIIITDPKAKKIIEWHSVDSTTKNNENRQIHLTREHGIKTRIGSSIHRPARKIIGLSDADADSLADSLIEEIDRLIGGTI